MSLALATARWVGLHVLRHPLTWLWIALSTAAWPAVTGLAPIGLTGGSDLETGLIYEIAFIGALLGALQGSVLIERGGWFLAGRGNATRLSIELSALTATSAVLVLPALALPLLARGGVPGGLWVRLVLAHLHLAGLTLVLLRLGLSTSARAAALLAAVWLLPAVADPETFAGRFIGSSLAAGRALMSGVESVPAGSVWKDMLAPIIGLVVAASLVRPTDPLHALRHPR